MTIVTEHGAKERVRELVRECKTKLGVDKTPPYEGPNHPLAKLLKIEIIEGQGVLYGGMYLSGKAPQIVIEPYGYSERLNFTFFHEVMHHLIRTDDELYGFLDDYGGQNFKAVLEEYCNIGAAEFLIPSEDMKKVFRDKGFYMALLQDLDASYPASRPAIAIQMAQCAAHDCIIVVCELNTLAQEEQTQPLMGKGETLQSLLQISYSSCSPSYKYRPPARGVPIAKHHLICNAYDERSSLQGKADVPFRSGSHWTVDCDAFYYKGKVYAAFNLTAPPPPASLQPSLFNE